MNVNLTPNITGKNVNIIKGATQADLTNSVNNSKTYRDEAEAFSIVSEAKSVEASYSALNASISSTNASDKATIATTKANEASNSANSASASETVCIAKATIATDNADIAIAQAVIATNKATEANTSANTANTQANIAITKASEASISAINALTSENNADTSEANALIYRNQAESFANSINPSDLVHISGTETITGNKTFSGTVSGLTKATVGLSNVDNTSDANKPISNAVQTALYLKADKATTLGGYGITDAYTKTSTDSLIDIHSKTAKTTLADADEFMTADSTSSWSLKKITWESIKTLLANLFIPKVTSTDNAIVRFNGTTGDVQNSGVIIDDNGNITASTADSTSGGSEAFSIKYEEGQKPNVISSARSSSAWSFGFGVKPSGTTAGMFISTVDNDNWPRGTLLVAETLKFLKAPTQNTAVGSTVSMTEVFRTTSGGDLLLTSGTGALGYGTGAGGTVTQLTSKSTAVVLNKPTGTIITHNATMVSGAAVSFSVTNTLVSNTDTIVPSTSTTSYAYTINCVGVANGSFIIRIVNNAASSLSENIAINFTIIKGANA